MFIPSTTMDTFTISALDNLQVQIYAKPIVWCSHTFSAAAYTKLKLVPRQPWYVLQNKMEKDHNKLKP